MMNSFTENFSTTVFGNSYSTLFVTDAHVSSNGGVNTTTQAKATSDCDLFPDNPHYCVR